MKPPLLDKRTRDDVLKQALTLAGRNAPPGWAGYVPDWTAPADTGEPGHRLLESFARLMELLIERLNQVPQTNFLSFLDLAGIERFPGAPAEVPVTFLVSKRAPLGGVVPAGTQVATTQTKNVDARVFETRRDFYASLARLESIVSVHPASNQFVIVPPPPPQVTAASLAASPIRVLTDTEPTAQQVPHILYLASEELFGKNVAAVDITIDLSAGTFPNAVAWHRFDKDAGWVDLPDPTITTTSVPNRVRFRFAGFTGTAKTKVAGVDDFWIAAQFTGNTAAIATLPVVSAINGALTVATSPGPRLDAAFYNASRLDVTRPFMPFGARPAFGDAFYFASDVAFSPGNSAVTLTFAIRPYSHADLAQQFAGLPTGGMSIRTRARWQYRNVAGQWADIAFFDHEFQFAANTGAVTRVSHSPLGTAGEGTFVGTSDGDGTVVVSIAAFPNDIGVHEVNGVTSRWFRVVLESENPYGHDGVLTGAGTTTPRFVGPLFIPPRVNSLSIAIVPRANVPITRVKTLNNFEFRDQSASAAIVPFVDISQRVTGGHMAFGTSSALYCGFDRQLEPEALISVFFDLAGRASTLSSPLESGNPVIAWEYWSDAGGWRPLDAADATLNLTTSGTVAFVAPRGAAPAALFEQIDPASAPGMTALWWVRARLSSGQFDYPPALRSVYINTVGAENRSTLSKLLIGSSNGEPDQTFALVKGPVLAGDVWVREPERPTAAEIRELDTEHAIDRNEPAPPATLPSTHVRDVTDGSGEVWVRWRRVPNFRTSGPRSRHYLLDSVAAIVRFGSGLRGHIPAIGRNNLVFRDLQTGGGALANRETGPLSVKELKVSLPFIDKVFNVQAASGGASSWTIAEFEEFGPQSLKNRGRAVTTEDYAWMVRQRFSDVARVRCRPLSEPGPGGTLQFKAGGVTALVVPWSTEPRPQPSEGLIRKVREFLMGVVLANIIEDVHVKGPDYVAVDVEATLVPKRPEFAMVVARKAQAALDAFLHPLTGGENQRGYGFGRSVFLSEVQAVLERIDEVDHVVSARFVGAPTADAVAITGDRLASSGVHHITVLDAGS